MTFLDGEGEVSVLMRTHDWSTSSLGPPASWPQSLKSVAGLLLNSRFPMFVAWGPDLCFLYNDAYAEILGIKHPSALGARFQDIWSEIWHDISPLVTRALAGEAIYQENLPLTMRRHGFDEHTWFTFSYSPVRDESGAVAGMYCACTETTAVVLAQRDRIAENERLHALFEQAPSFMAVVRGPHHVFELVNTAYLQLIGHRDVVGKTVFDALPEIREQGFIELLDGVYTSGEPFVGNGLPVVLQRQPGGAPEKRFVDFVYQPIRDVTNAVTGIFAVGSDVTERMLALEALQKSDRRKDEFLAMLAHELRNPLAPISTAAQILKLADLNEQRIRQTGDVIARQAEHMTNLVDDLLDVSRVTRGLATLQKEMLDLNLVVHSAIEQVRPLIESRQHVLTVDMAIAHAFVEGDRTRLVQVIVNLLNNAAKYTPQGGAIGLQVSANASQVQLAVSDNGMGIDPTLLPHVFDLFTQGERTPDRSQGGLGLGLALVKKLVELHGGRIEAHSAGPGSGSVFTFTLPLLQATTHDDAEHVGRATAAAAASVRLMIVDDNADAAQTLAALLEAYGHEVTVTHDAHSTLQQAEQEAPQAFILDIGLPDLNGYELARRLRARPITAGATLIALTGYGQQHDRVLSKAAGFDYHLVKPVDSQQLMAILSQIS